VRVLKILATFSHVSIRTAIVLESLFILSLETPDPLTADRWPVAADS